MLIIIFFSTGERNYRYNLATFFSFPHPFWLVTAGNSGEIWDFTEISFWKRKTQQLYMFDSNIIWVSYYERNLNVKAAFSFGVIEWGPIWGGSLKPSSGSLGDWLLLGNWVLANQPVTTVPAQPNHHIFDRLPFQHIKRNACQRIKRILLEEDYPKKWKWKSGWTIQTSFAKVAAE